MPKHEPQKLGPVVGPFHDYHILELSKERGQRNRAIPLYRMSLIANKNGTLFEGGIDDIEALETTDNDEHRQALYQTRLHKISGTIEVSSKSCLSERGMALLKRWAVDLDVLDHGGVLHIRIISTFHRYEVIPSFDVDAGTWVTSVCGYKDNPSYVMYRVLSHQLETWNRFKLFRERNWWLLFVRKYLKDRATVPTKKRKIDGIVRYYLEKYPFHVSGINSSEDFGVTSALRRKHVTAGAVYTGLARHAVFIKSKLMTQNPQPMSLMQWDELLECYERSPAYRDEPALDSGSGSSSDDSLFGEHERDEDEGMDLDSIIPQSQEPPREHEADSIIEDDDRHEFDPGWLNSQNEVDELDELNSLADALDLDPVIDKNAHIHIYRPNLRPNFTYKCPFQPVGAPTWKRGQWCPFKIDLRNDEHWRERALTEEQRYILRRRDFANKESELKDIFSCLLDRHIRAHKADQSAMGSHSSQVYRVELMRDQPRVAPPNRNLGPKSAASSTYIWKYYIWSSR